MKEQIDLNQILEAKMNIRKLIHLKKYQEAYQYSQSLYEKTYNMQYYYYMGKALYLALKKQEARPYFELTIQTTKKLESAAFLANICRENNEMDLAKKYIESAQYFADRRRQKKGDPNKKIESILFFAMYGSGSQDSITQESNKDGEVASTENVEKMIEEGLFPQLQETFTIHKDDIEYLSSGIRALYLSGYEGLGDRYLRFALKKENKTKEEKAQLRELQENKKLYLKKSIFK